MRSSKAILARVVALGTVVVVGFFTFGGCETGGNEGDRCNPLVQQDECHSGLHCQLVNCSIAYCCPTNGSTAEPNCRVEGCPDEDAGDAEVEGGDAADAGDAG